MKKVLLFAVVVAGLGFTSCSSSGDCECTVNGETETTTKEDFEVLGVELSDDEFEAFCELGEGCEIA